MSVYNFTFSSKVCRKDYEHSEMSDMMKIDTEVKNVSWFRLVQFKYK